MFALLLFATTLFHISITLRLPLNPSILQGFRDPCLDTRSNNVTLPALGYYMDLPFWTRVHNDSIYFRLDKGGDSISSTRTAELLFDLSFIRTNIEEEWPIEPVTQMVYHHEWVWTYWYANLEEGRKLTDITKTQAANVITTVCSLIRSCGPEEMESAVILDSARGNELVEFGMIFNTEP